MQQNNRGQAALEFLLTYSWAILVVIVIIGALAYFGVLSPTNFIPEKCQFGAGLACADYAYDPTAGAAQYEFRVVNGLGRSVDIQEIVVFGPDLAGTNNDNTDSCTLTAGSGAVTIANGDYADVTVTGADCEPLALGQDSLRAEVQIEYVFTGGLASTKYNLGEIFVKNVQ